MCQQLVSAKGLDELTSVNARAKNVPIHIFVFDTASLYNGA